MEQNKATRLIGTIFSAIGGTMLLAGVAFFVAYRRTARLELGILSMVFSLMGAIFAALGGVFLGVCHRRKKLTERLLSEGNCVRAEITGVTVNPMVQVNGRSPFRVECRYRAPDGAVHVFHSGDLDFDPTGLFLTEAVDVYVDRYDMGKYYVDLSRVLPEVQVH